MQNNNSNDKSYAEIENHKDVFRRNGQIIFGLLKKSNKATVLEITRELTSRTNLDADVVKPVVKAVLKRAVDGGFIFRDGLKYSIQPPDEEEEEQEEQGEEPESSDPDERRRTRSRSRSRKRSHSRRRSARRTGSRRR